MSGGDGDSKDLGRKSAGAEGAVAAGEASDAASDEAVLSAIGNAFPALPDFVARVSALDPDRVDGNAEAPSFGGFEKVLGEELLSSGGPELQYVAKFFDNFAEQMGLTEAAFFKNELCLEHFRQSFREFQVYLAREIEQIEDLRSRAIPFNEFSDSWQDLMKTASYYAFFLHYGATRSREYDVSGNPRHYIYHPVRATYKVMGKRLWYLAEPEFVAEVTHDTREDVHKGMLAVLMADDEALNVFANESDTIHLYRFTREAKTKRKAQALQLLDPMEEHLDSQACASGGRDLTVSELIALLTKKSDNRSRSFLQMFSEILKYDKNGRLFEAAVALDICKVCDRFDNSVSLSPGGSAGHIKNETAYLFLARAIALQAWNEVDWWHDYLMKVDPDARRILNALMREESKTRTGRRRSQRDRRVHAAASGDQSTGKEETVTESPATLKDEFRNEFRHKLRLESGKRDLIEGRDYVLEFRDIGMRYEDLENARAKASKGNLEKTFRNYVIFYPLRTDRDLCQAAAAVFKKLCPDDLDKDHLRRPELRSDLGRRIVENRCGVPLVANGKSRKYGVVIWGIMKHQRDAITTFHGDYHLGKFDLGNEDARMEARERVEDFYRKVAPEVNNLQRQYAMVDRFEAGVTEGAEPKDVSFWTKLAIGLSRIGKSIVGLGSKLNVEEKLLENLKVGNLRRDDAEVMRDVLDKQVLLLFMYKEERELMLNGSKVKGLVPREVTDEQALYFICPFLCLGRRIKKIHDGVFEAEPGPFSEAQCHRQSGFIGNILADYRRELLADELALWRDERVRRPQTR